MAFFSFPTYDLKPVDYTSQRTAANVCRAGIIGGLGPQSTSLFYDTITNFCLRHELPNSPSLLINSVNCWKVVDMLARQDMEALYHYLLSELLVLQGQVDFIVMVCNSVHVVVDRLREALEVPIMAIHEEVCREIALSGVRRAGILGTRTTIDTGLYQRELEGFGIAYASLPPQQVQEMDDCIFQEMLHGRQLGQMRQLLIKGAEQLYAEGCEAVVLACTELPLFLQAKDVQMPLFSSTEVLAERVVVECLGMGR